MGIKIERLDHLVLTVASIERTVQFYETVLGMSAVTFGPQNRVALTFGNQKINLHEEGREFEPKAKMPTAGSGDLCFIVEDFAAVEKHLAACGIEIEVDASPRTGATGPIQSIYIRDPDENLIELSTYVTTS